MERVKVADVEQIYALWNEYAAAVNAGDMERWLTLWVEDGLQMPPDAARRSGMEAIRAGNQSFFDQFEVKMAIYPDEVQVLGNEAYSHGLYEFAMTAEKGEETIQGTGKFLTILRKQIDGSWKIAIDCFNYNTPLD